MDERMKRRTRAVWYVLVGLLLLAAFGSWDRFAA